LTCGLLSCHTAALSSTERLTGIPFRTADDVAMTEMQIAELENLQPPRPAKALL
jgi:hypothetical protein